MKRYLLDTNAVSDRIFRRRGVAEKAEEARAKGGVIGTCLPVLAELFGGIEKSSTRDANMVIVNRNLGLFRHWPFTLEASREFGRLFAIMRKGGISIQTVDLMAAAIALTLGNCTVVSSDSDLKRVPGLSVENWATT